MMLVVDIGLQKLLFFLISNKNIVKNNFCNELIELVKEHYNKKILMMF